MEASSLYESPFTSVAPLGPDQLFSTAEVRDLIGILESVEATARVA